VREYDVVCLPDMQVPYHDKKFIEAMTRFVRDYQPAKVANVGDLVDAPEPSRWNKGMAGEYALTLQAGFDESARIVREFVNAAPNAEHHLKMGNHDERVETYVTRYAPALTSLRDLKVENLLGLEQMGVQLQRDVYKIAPGWLLAHGHESGLNSTAGGTALGLARKTGMSVVCGHTHKAGIQSTASGYAGRLNHLYGMEVGHAMVVGKAQYLKYGGAAWTKAFGILHVRGNTVTPELVIAEGGAFEVDGKRYAF
jgi:metallophosphoesterase superfamily enzyme